MRICIVYDCLFPWTIGGAERWYRNIALRLAAAGHDVTYLTLCQWDADDAPALPGVRVVAVGPRMALYVGHTRALWPPVRFGIGVGWHLLRHGRRYDQVHTASFPFFSLLAAGALRRWRGYRLSVDWHEVLSNDYWRRYLGRLGTVGAWVQRRCARIDQHAFVFSDLHRRRALALGVAGPVERLTGEYDGPDHDAQGPTDPPTFVYAGRMIAEKRVGLLIDALALAMTRRPGVVATLFGRGPEYAAMQARVASLGLTDRIGLPGFVDQATIDAAMAGAVAIVQPSARGVPAIVVPAADNAAVELVHDGINGYMARDATPEALADALLNCLGNAAALRASTRVWYAAHRTELSIEASVARLLAVFQATRRD